MSFLEANYSFTPDGIYPKKFSPFFIRNVNHRCTKIPKANYKKKPKSLSYYERYIKGTSLESLYKEPSIGYLSQEEFKGRKGIILKRK